MTTTTIATRRARAEDAFGIAAVHDASWRQAYGGIIPHKALEAMVRRRGPAWWAKAVRNSTRVLVMEAEGRIVGYATLGPNRVPALAQKGEIYELYLQPEYQGVGLGKQLFLAARQELAASGMRDSLAWVLEDNAPAIRFYRNAGGLDVAEGTETFDGRTLNKLAFAFD